MKIRYSRELFRMLKIGDSFITSRSDADMQTEAFRIGIKISTKRTKLIVDDSLIDVVIVTVVGINDPVIYKKFIDRERERRRKPKPCKYPGCPEHAEAWNLCNTHYVRVRRIIDNMVVDHGDEG